MTRTVQIEPSRLDAIFEPHNRVDRPGVTVGVAHQGRPVYRKGFGAASVELPMALTPTMRLRIGSTTKHFCCLAIMLLAQEGKLTPKDSVRRHIPELGEWAEGVTLAALMSHTSGTRCSLDLLSSTAQVMGRALPHGDQVKLLTGLASPNFAPGEDWMYSNGGYVLLTEVVRRLSGESFETFLQQRILQPVGMVDSLARPVDTDMLPNSATLHVPDKTGGWKRGVFGPEIGGEGSMVSTIDDMLRWLAHMETPTVGSAETWAAMTTPRRLNDGTNTGYGFGLAMNDYRGVRTISHGGTVIGGNCQMLKVVDERLDIVVLSNLPLDVATLAEKVIDACIEGLEPLDEEPPPFPFPTGTFFSPRTGRHLTLVEHEGAPALDVGGAPYPLKRRAGRTLWLRLNLADGATMRAAADGGVEVVEFGRADHLKRVEPPEADGLAEIEGRWRSDEIEADVQIAAGEAGEGRISLVTPHGAADYAMKPIAQGVWLAGNDAIGMTLTLEQQGKALLFSSSRSRRLRFERAAG